MLRKLLSQGASVAALRVVGTGLSVCVTIAIARLFGADALGVYAYCVALTAIAAVPVANGWSTMLLRAVSAAGTVDRSARAMAGTGMLVAVAVAALAAMLGIAAIFLGRGDVALSLRPVAFTAIALLAIALASDQIAAMRMATIRGIDRPALAQVPEMLVRPLLLLVGIAAVWLAFGTGSPAQDLLHLFSALAAAALLSAIFGQFVLRLIAPPSPGGEEKVDRRGWFASALALGGSAGLVQLNGYVDMIILGAFATPAELGLYRTALQIAMLASFGYVALNMLAGQRFARLRRTESRAELERTATWLARMGLVTALPLPLILLLDGEWIFALLFGPEFRGAALPSLIVASGLTFSCAVGMARTLLVMHHFEFLVMRTTFAALAINIGLSLVLIPRYGIVGAAVANCTATVCWNALLWCVARKKTNIDSSAIGLFSRRTDQEGAGA